MKHYTSVFPVYAGVILAYYMQKTYKRCVPRVCGGDPEIEVANLIEELCSPCMRG